MKPEIRPYSLLCARRSALPSGRGGTDGRTSTQSVPAWPAPCPSPPRRRVSAFTASSSPQRCEPEGHGPAPRSPAGEMAARLSRPPCLWRGPAPSHTLHPQAQLALRAQEAPPQPPAEQKFQAYGSSQGHGMSKKIACRTGLGPGPLASLRPHPPWKMDWKHRVGARQWGIQSCIRVLSEHKMTAHWRPQDVLRDCRGPLAAPRASWETLVTVSEPP